MQYLATTVFKDRAERSAAISNAQVIVSCINAHNAVADTDSAIDPISGAMTDNMITLSGVDKDSGTAVADISTPDLFNDCCENQISGMSEEDYGIALEYITILTGPDEYGLKEGYDHTT